MIHYKAHLSGCLMFGAVFDTMGATNTTTLAALNSYAQRKLIGVLCDAIEGLHEELTVCGAGYSRIIIRPTLE